MLEISKKGPWVILLHDAIDRPEDGKTGLALLQYAENPIAAVIDRKFAGKSFREAANRPDLPDVPIVASMEEALAFGPAAVAIGLAPLGGQLTEFLWGEIETALAAGVDVINGLHADIAGDPRVSEAMKSGAQVWNVRREPKGLKSGSGAATKLTAERILFVGTDMAVGKMTAGLELHRYTRAQGKSSHFVATGQTGIMITGAGIPLDAIRIDYASGSVEAEMLKANPDADVIWVEGQGSLLNPASTATLPLMRGAQPTAMILVHRAAMKTLADFPHIPIPPLDEVVALNETMASACGNFGAPKVVGIALNCWGLDDGQAQAAVDAAQALTNLPVTDVMRFGCAPLYHAVFQQRASRIAA
jgi:uncharacterized NAD-dependent epimerase/dehydratase family protein